MIPTDSAPSPLSPPHADRGVPGLFHRGAYRRRSRQRRSAWSVRERRLGQRLDLELAGWAIALHSRLPGPGVDCRPIDHLVIDPGGVWVIAADHDLGRIATGACEAVVANRRDEMERQRGALRTVLSSIGFDWLDVDLAVCATNAQGVRRRPLQVDGIWCAQSGSLPALMTRPGTLGHPDVAAIAVELSTSFPAAR